MSAANNALVGTILNFSFTNIVYDRSLFGFLDSVRFTKMAERMMVNEGRPPKFAVSEVVRDVISEVPETEDRLDLRTHINRYESWAWDCVFVRNIALTIFSTKVSNFFRNHNNYYIFFHFFYFFFSDLD